MITAGIQWWRLAATSSPGPGGPNDPPPPDPGLDEPVTGEENTSLPLVEPIAAYKLFEGFGACIRTNQSSDPFSGSGAEGVKSWLDKLKNMGVTYVRGMYQAPGATATSGNLTSRTAFALIPELEKRNMKWLMTVATEGDNVTDMTMDAIAQKVDDIARYASGVCLAVEGINEPQYNRGATAPPVDADTWADITVEISKTISDRIAANRLDVERIGPSLQDNAADASYTATDPEGGKFHHHQLVDRGIKAHIDRFGFHTYPKRGSRPLEGMGDRLVHINDAYGDFPGWVTEHGWTTPGVDNDGGIGSNHARANEDAAGLYLPRGVLQIIGMPWIHGAATLPVIRSMGYGYFEANDAYDDSKNAAGTRIYDDVEDHFGLFRVGQRTLADSLLASTWTAKPAVAEMTNALHTPLFEAAVSPYTVRNVRFQMRAMAATSDVQWALVQKSDKKTYLYYWRNALLMNTSTKDSITVAPVSITYTDSSGTFTKTDCDGRVRSVQVALVG